MNLPQELIDKIIDGVWDADDSPLHTTTKAASLISKSWVDRSQRYLFHTIEFSAVGDQFARWCNIMTPGPDGASRHVHSLTIHARELDGWWINEDFLERVLPYFESFRNVQVFRVLHWNVESFPLGTLTRCFTPFAEGIRLLQWDPHRDMTRETWDRVVGLFPVMDYLLLHPIYFPAGLLFDTPVDPARKKLIFSGTYAGRYLIGRNLHFREIHMRCSIDVSLDTIIAIINSDADRLEILSIQRVGRVINASNASTFASFLGSCRALHELWIDWLPVEEAPELYLLDAISGGCIQSLRIMPSRVFWEHMWIGVSGMGTPWLTVRSSHVRLAQVILQLGIRFSSNNDGRKIAVWFAIPQVPYVMWNPIRDSVIALWDLVEDVVSFGFQMIVAEFRNVDMRYSIPSLEL
ncbi:hypothetical protein BDM02DRAFT_3267294 [Thelephora ganbajun]|uniref:Uncharacterized protein n=1 Tax=Thelephora ganbajun TaxID=370292 RepID=A0ACB6ZNU7_THEGA|nr:hypothetical protein BDM02DRAFT_3267294 [Thelephora ganbajun]